MKASNLSRAAGTVEEQHAVDFMELIHAFSVSGILQTVVTNKLKAVCLTLHNQLETDHGCNFITIFVRN
jgi:hypothetical protein